MFIKLKMHLQNVEIKLYSLHNILQPPCLNDSCIRTIRSRRRDRCDSQTLSADRWRGCAFWQSAE